MSRFRDHQRFRARYRSRSDRRRRGMITLRLQDSLAADDLATVTGRAAADQTREEDEVERCFPVGFWAAPAETSVVESLVVNVGGDPDFPVEANTIDRSRAAARVAVGAEGAVDTSIVYTGQVALHLGSDGLVYIGPLGDFTGLEPVVRKSEYDALRAVVLANNVAILAHQHAVGGLPVGLMLETPAVITGSEVLRTK